MFELPKLPYKLSALEPYISSETMRYHYGKHHAGYVKKLNELTKGTEYNDMSLTTLIKVLEYHNGNNQEVLDMAGQHYNHSFYWKSMKPHGETRNPQGFLLEYINASFGSFDTFKTNFIDLASKEFGSGWLWLVQYRSPVCIVSTHDGEAIISDPECRPLLVCDLWEHAYYLDYKNQRERYIKNFLKIINWEFAEQNIELS